ncbi:hypothetical protein BpHYR1_045120 [Brachionus plicatilis]|uniref:Uncharacterized protein n=1 Tax=Brachionus plicatilis TaxID=10195 RepID=A0A3M7PIJ5_BRAPC|nr:hypothetical protein BpHYR1_045120 [Brachionus plicatilis]
MYQLLQFTEHVLLLQNFSFGTFNILLFIFVPKFTIPVLSLKLIEFRFEAKSSTSESETFDLKTTLLSTKSISDNIFDFRCRADGKRRPDLTNTNFTHFILHSKSIKYQKNQLKFGSNKNVTLTDRPSVNRSKWRLVPSD